MAKTIIKATKSTPFMVVMGLVIVAAVGFVIIPKITLADQPGAIWTTTNSCGDPQNVNHYNNGDHVFINGSGFNPDNYNWDITGTPGADPSGVVASGTVTVDGSGAFCFDAYTIGNDNGVYKASVDNKNDNYSVTGDVQEPFEPSCGDGVINQQFEQCDVNAGVGEHQVCTDDCTLETVPYCGDGAVNQTTEQCDGTDGVGENQSCTTQCTLESKIVPGAPSLSLTKIVDKALVNPDNTLNYTIVVSNSGQAVAVNVALTDTLPAGLTYLDDQNKNTGETTWTWTWPLLEAGKDVTVKYAVHVDSQATAKNYTNTALVKADNFSPAVSASATTEVRIPTVLGDEAPALTIDKVVDRAFANPGDTVLYTVKVTNTGNTPAINAVLTDVLPTGLVFVDSSTTTATWKLGDIVPTESVTKTYKVKLDGSLLAGAYANSATVKADNVDPLTTQVSLNVREVQVLGAEDEVKVLGAELPDTGAGLLGVLAGLLLLGSGLVISRKTK